jgi:hypothetical protein
MKLTVVLGTSSEASFDIMLVDNSFTRKWVNELSWCVDNCEFNQIEAFASNMTLQDSGKSLLEACVTINRYFKNFIEIREHMLDQPQEYFNYLHSRFELLSGKFGKPTKLFAVANPELKNAIRNLNFFLHRIETHNHPVAGLYISFNKDQYRRHAFEKDDYDFFEFKFPAGTLFLHYVELGKEFIDLYEDNLTLDYAGFQNLHFYSGEASLTMKPYDAFEDSGYKQWLLDHGIDVYNKHLGHGRIPLGHIDNLHEVEEKLTKFRYLKKIYIKDE